MIKAKKGGVIHIFDSEEPEEIKRYLFNGYDIYKDGKLVEKAIPTNINELRISYSEHVAEIKKLNAEIINLKKQLTSKKKVEKE